MLKWEDIPQSTSGVLQRTKVHGGWLVKEVHEVYVDLKIDHIRPLEGNGYTWTSSLTFIPDINHEWKLE
jgi:hypothetical protein